MPVFWVICTGLTRRAIRLPRHWHLRRTGRHTLESSAENLTELYHVRDDRMAWRMMRGRFSKLACQVRDGTVDRAVAPSKMEGGTPVAPDRRVILALYVWGFTKDFLPGNFRLPDECARLRKGHWHAGTPRLSPR